MRSKVVMISAASTMGRELDDTKHRYIKHRNTRHRNTSSNFTALSFFLSPLYQASKSYSQDACKIWSDQNETACKPRGYKQHTAVMTTTQCEAVQTHRVHTLMCTNLIT